MATEQEVLNLLEEHGAVLVRQKGGHRVFHIPGKGPFTVASTSSDRRAWDNNISLLRRLLGVKREIRKSSLRRDKCPLPRPLYKGTPTQAFPTLQSQLAEVLTSVRYTLPTQQPSAASSVIINEPQGDYQFADDAVLEAIKGSDHDKRQITGLLNLLTQKQKNLLYRAISELCQCPAGKNVLASRGCY